MKAIENRTVKANSGCCWAAGAHNPENPVSLLRLAFFGEKGLLYRVERSSSLSASRCAARSNVDQDHRQENHGQVRGEDVDGGREDGQNREQNENLFAAEAVGGKSPKRAQDRAADVSDGMDDANGESRVTDLT